MKILLLIVYLEFNNGFCRWMHRYKSNKITYSSIKFIPKW